MSGAIFTADVWLLYFYFFVWFSIFDILNFSTKEGRVNPPSFLKLVYECRVCACVCICVNIYVYMWPAHTFKGPLGKACTLGLLASDQLGDARCRPLSYKV